MFNPYGFQGGTATLDPQSTGMNGHARIAEAMNSFAQNIVNPQALTGIPVGQPNVIPGAIPNFAPTGYGYPTFPTPTFGTTFPTQFAPGYQPFATPFGFASTPVNPWVQPGYNPYLGQVTPFANPFCGVPTTSPFVPSPFGGTFVNPSIPFGGFPYAQNPGYFPGFNPAFANPQYAALCAQTYGYMPSAIPGTLPFGGVSPVTQVPFVNPTAGIRSPFAQPAISNFVTPWTTPHGMYNPMVPHPFFSQTAGLTSLVNPLVGNPLAGIAPVGNLPFAGSPAVVYQVASQHLAAGVDPVTTACICAAACGCNPIALLPTIQSLALTCQPFGGTSVNPLLAGRLGLGITNPGLSNPLFSTINPLVQNAVNPILNNLIAPGLGTTSPWNNPYITSGMNSLIPTIGGCASFANPLSFHGIPGYTPGIPNLGAINCNYGFGGINQTPAWPLNSNTCWPSYCI